MPERYPVPAEMEGIRLDRFLAGRLENVSRSRVQHWLDEARVSIEGFGGDVKPSLPLKGGWTVLLDRPEPPPSALAPEPVPLHILHEDELILVLNKPPGIAVHPGAGEPKPTLAHGILHHEPGRAWPGPPDRPGIVHRLDRETSGLLVVAKTEAARLDLIGQISRHDAGRGYIALVWGTPASGRGMIDSPIGRDPRIRTRMAVRKSGGRPALTRYRLLRAFDRVALLDVRLETGRTHQIRVHMEHAGFPVFGDPVYGGKRFVARLAPAERPLWIARVRRLNRQALHAYHLHFRHPRDGKAWGFEAPPPHDLEDLLMELTAGA